MYHACAAGLAHRIKLSVCANFNNENNIDFLQIARAHTQLQLIDPHNVLVDHIGIKGRKWKGGGP